MRAIWLAPLVLSTLMAGPATAQVPRFIKVDVVSKNLCHHGEDGPTEVHLRVPIAMAKGILDLAGEQDVKINGKTTKDLKVEQLVKLLEGAKPGDLLLEITTDKGDLVQITVQ